MWLTKRRTYIESTCLCDRLGKQRGRNRTPNDKKAEKRELKSSGGYYRRLNPMGDVYLEDGDAAVRARLRPLPQRQLRFQELPVLFRRPVFRA